VISTAGPGSCAYLGVVQAVSNEVFYTLEEDRITVYNSMRKQAATMGGNSLLIEWACWKGAQAQVYLCE